MPTDPCTEEYLLPQVEALLAGTLALMTGLSHTEGPCALRELMRDKVRANLQELAAHRGLAAPRYEHTASGPDHDRRFEARAVVGSTHYAPFIARSKKLAEQGAAELAHQQLFSQS